MRDKQVNRDLIYVIDETFPKYDYLIVADFNIVKAYIIKITAMPEDLAMQTTLDYHNYRAKLLSYDDLLTRITNRIAPFKKIRLN